MFNFFNFKAKNLIPSDIDKSLMSSNFCTIKLGEKLQLKENITCLICYKDKIYHELSAGSYHLTRELLIDLYSKQTKNDRKLKKLKADLYFANTKPFTLEFDYVDKIPLNNNLTKIIFDVKAEINIKNAKDFYSFIVSETPETDAVYSEQQTMFFIEETIKTYFLKIKLTSLNLSSEMKNELQEKLTKQLEKIGLNLISFNLSLSTKTQISVNETKSSFFDFELTHENVSIQQTNTNSEIKTFNENLVDLNENLDYTNNEQPNENSTEVKNEELKNCPNCKCKLIKGSAFCHRCGYKI